MENPVHPADEAAPRSSSGRNNGGWITFPFILATMAGLSLAAGGWMMNLIVYLIQEFNMKSISAAKVFNVFNGFTTIFPILAGIIADSFLGCFPVIWVSSLISALGLLLLLLTSTIDGLRPPACVDGCKNPSTTQYAVLYVALVLTSLGVAGTRFTIGPMGAYQFDNPKHQGIFFNWYIFTLYTSVVISSTVIVYVEDNVSWAWGYGISALLNMFGLFIFLSGKRFYRHVKEHEVSPFISMARVIVAAIQKRRVPLSGQSESYYHEPISDKTTNIAQIPTRSFKFLNRAAFISEGDTKSDGSIKNAWRLCTVQQVEDLKSLMKLFPLWISALPLTTQIVVQSSLLVLQALKMDRQMGPHFKIPASSMIIFVLMFTSITISLIDRVLCPLLAKFTNFSLTPLRRIGVGHVLTIIGMAVSAVVESKRLKVVNNHSLQGQENAIVPMSVFWLVPQLAIVGVGEAFHFPGHIAFYYQEFPVSLKSTSTAIVAMYVGIGYYLGNAVIDVVQRVTGWLPDNINDGRLDNVFWLSCVLGSLNLIYYLLCASLYKYRNLK